MKRLAMRFKAVWLLAFLFLVPALSFAGGSTCLAATGLMPDGRILDLDYIQPGATVWYSFGASSGHSYSVEARDDLDGNPNTDLSITFYSGACATQMTGASGPPYSANQYRDTSNPNNETIAIKVVNNSTTIGHYLSASVSETTMFSTAWLATGNYNTYYAWVNTTSFAINGTLNFWDTLNGGSLAPPSPIALPLPPRGTSNNTSSSSLNLPRSYGAMFFTHDGPPGAIVATAMAADFTVSPPATQEYKFGPVREAAH